MNNLKLIAGVMAFLSLVSCRTADEKAASALAHRVVPGYAGHIVFEQTSDQDSYCIFARKGKIVVQGGCVNAMTAGLGRYLRDVCAVDVSWDCLHPVDMPSLMPLPDGTIRSEALVKDRFFLNYCTFGYTMPWWKWEDWERFIDWMALQGINLPLAQTGQEAVLQELWRRQGLSDDEIRAWFTGPAHLPWHRMCNIDGVDGPLPQGWIDGQEALQKRILKRERELGMRPVLPAFNGHVPPGFKKAHPEAMVSDISSWGGFSPDYLPHFLSPCDSLFGALQVDYLRIQTEKYGTSHIYGFDLFNEVDPPSWDAETLAEISRKAYGSIASRDPDAEWLQMGWMFWYDRKHWTPEIIKAYLEAVPQGRVTILDYYTEAVPVWTLTDKFCGQPYIFCYLGNFGGNTRFAGPFRKESMRIAEALSDGGAAGIGCTLEGFGINRWFYEYVMDRAWSEGLGDDEWLHALDRRSHSPGGFWKQMADSVYVRGSFSEGALICGRPCLKGYHHWTVINKTPYDNRLLAAAWKSLLDARAESAAWRCNAVTVGCQALGNHFASLRDSLELAYAATDAPEVSRLSGRMRELLHDVADLAACEPSFRLQNWLSGAVSWASDPGEEEYYRHNAWHIVTTWGYSPTLNDYASRLWSGLVSGYYAPRWELFLDELQACMAEKRPYDQAVMDARLEAFERDAVESAPEARDSRPEEDAAGLCDSLYLKWFGGGQRFQ